MLGHRVNSEGLRRRAIALGGGAPKRCYIVFGGRDCQPSDTTFLTADCRKGCSFCLTSRRHRGDRPDPGQSQSRCPAMCRAEPLGRGRHSTFRSHRAALRPHSSAVLGNSPIGGCRNEGKRQHHFKLCASTQLGLVDGPGTVEGIVSKSEVDRKCKRAIEAVWPSTWQPSTWQPRTWLPRTWGRKLGPS